MFLLIFHAQADGDAAALYRNALDRQRAGDLAAAVQLYRECLAEDASNFQARSNLGAALSGLGRFDEAIVEYSAALQAAPDNFKPLLERNVALAFYKSGRMTEASNAFGNLRSAHPGDRDLGLLAADCFLQLDQPAKAVDLLRPFHESHPQDKAVAWVLGIALLKSGQVSEAQQVLDPILKDTTSAEGSLAVGLAMFLRHDFPAARKAFEHAIELNAAMPRIYSYYGQSLLFTGDPVKAAEAFRKQLAADSNDFDANYQLAEILASQAKFSEAEPLLRRAVLLRPASESARTALSDTIAHRFTRDTASSPVGGLAPAVSIQRVKSAGRVQLPSVELGKPSVLVFGSYTCPQFRGAAPALNALAVRYGKQVSFLLVYIREAHSAGAWQSSINEREQITLKPPANLQERGELAQMCARKLELKFPAALDSMDGAAEKAYQAWPSRVYLIDAAGRIRFSSGLSDLEFDPKALEGELHNATKSGR